MTSFVRYRGRPTRVDPKDPQAEISYGLDWTDYLGDENILTSSWEAEDDLVVEASSSADGKKTSVLLSGGTDGKHYNVVNTITFSGANGTETDQRTIVVPVRDL